MKRRTEDEIIEFLKNNIEPLEDNVYGLGYRASVYLKDETFLPCVVFRNSKPIVELAMRRFDEEQKRNENPGKSSGVGYYEIVKNFVAHGNCINSYDIARVEKSRYALPLSIMKQIRGETTMSWTGFAVKMKDGKYFAFGTTYRFMFFDIPDTYSFDDIEEIVNHSYVTEAGELRFHRVPFFEFPDDYNHAILYRDRPYFECFVDNL